MSTVNVYGAKSSFSKLLARAEAGETIVRAERSAGGTARSHPDAPRPVAVGDLRGLVRIHDDFGAWSEQDERDWYGA